MFISFPETSTYTFCSILSAVFHFYGLHIYAFLKCVEDFLDLPGTCPVLNLTFQALLLTFILDSFL